MGSSPPLIGTWINCMLYTVELFEVWQFYHAKQSNIPTLRNTQPLNLLSYAVISPGGNHPLIRWLVAVMFVMDTVTTAGNCAWLYLVCHFTIQSLLKETDHFVKQCVTHWGDVVYLSGRNDWALVGLYVGRSKCLR
jgi:hypothetical protein